MSANPLGLSYQEVWLRQMRAVAISRLFYLSAFSPSEMIPDDRGTRSIDLIPPSETDFLYCFYKDVLELNLGDVGV